MHPLFKRLARRLAYTCGVYGPAFNVYRFMFSPAELIFLTDCIRDVEPISGTFVEAGCAHGATTVFLSLFMRDMGIFRRYYALDTFAGFTAGDIKHETEQRGKARFARALSDAFADNNKQWVHATIEHHSVSPMLCTADISCFDFDTLKPIAFCLLDVDLYQPTALALPRIYDALAPGGIMIVDDCWDNEKWEGAFAAYKEFTEHYGMPRRIYGRKLGMIVKPFLTPEEQPAP